jgi:hypothetical protein
MALRITRGLFRLWVVLSVLWVGGVGVSTWRNLPSTDLPDAPWIKQRTDAAPVDSNPPPPDYVVDKPTAPVFDPTKPYVELPDNAAIEHGVALAFIPPILVLAIGSASIEELVRSLSKIDQL